MPILNPEDDVPGTAPPHCRLRYPVCSNCGDELVRYRGRLVLIERKVYCKDCADRLLGRGKKTSRGKA